MCGIGRPWPVLLLLGVGAWGCGMRARMLNDSDERWGVCLNGVWGRETMGGSARVGKMCECGGEGWAA